MSISFFRDATLIFACLALSICMELNDNLARRVNQIMETKCYIVQDEVKAVYCTIPHNGMFLLSARVYDKVLQEGINAYMFAELCPSIPEDILNKIWNDNLELDDDNWVSPIAPYESDLKSIDLSNWWVLDSLKVIDGRFMDWLLSLPIKIGSFSLQAGLLGRRVDSKAISTLPKFANLLELRLRHREIGDDDLKEIIKIKGLKRLGLGDNPISDVGANYLATLKDLEEISVRHCKIGPKGAQSLSQLTKLKSINIDHNAIGDEGAISLSNLSELRDLNVLKCEIGISGAQAIGKLTNLQTLDIGANPIYDDGALHLSRLTKLEELGINDCRIGSASANIVNKFLKLQNLDIGNNIIGDDGVFELSKLPELKNLNVYGCNITSDGLRVISKMAKLTSLTIGCNPIDTKEFRCLSHLISLETEI